MRTALGQNAPSGPTSFRQRHTSLHKHKFPLQSKFYPKTPGTNSVTQQSKEQITECTTRAAPVSLVSLYHLHSQRCHFIPYHIYSDHLETCRNAHEHAGATGRPQAGLAPPNRSPLLIKKHVDAEPHEDRGHGGSWHLAQTCKALPARGDDRSVQGGLLHGWSSTGGRGQLLSDKHRTRRLCPVCPYHCDLSSSGPLCLFLNCYNY